MLAQVRAYNNRGAMTYIYKLSTVYSARCIDCPYSSAVEAKSSTLQSLNLAPSSSVASVSIACMLAKTMPLTSHRRGVCHLLKSRTLQLKSQTKS